MSNQLVVRAVGKQRRTCNQLLITANCRLLFFLVGFDYTWIAFSNREAVRRGEVSTFRLFQYKSQRNFSFVQFYLLPSKYTITRLLFPWPFLDIVIPKHTIRSRHSGKNMYRWCPYVLQYPKNRNCIILAQHNARCEEVLPEEVKAIQISSLDEISKFRNVLNDRKCFTNFRLACVLPLNPLCSRQAAWLVCRGLFPFVYPSALWSEH